MQIVSVIIPCYNTGQFIGEAINSVLKQTFQEFEIIIVDDGSTDNTAEVVGRFTDSRIRYIRQENRGLAGARNTGIRNAKGKFVAFLDADDLFLPNKLNHQIQYLNDHKTTDLVASGWIMTDINCKTLRINRPWEWVPELRLRDWLFECPVAVHSVLVKAEWIRKVGYFDESLESVEDWDLWLRMVYSGCQMDWLKEILVIYRMHSGNMIHDTVKMRQGLNRTIEKFYSKNDIPEKIVELKERAFAFTYLRSAMRGYIYKNFILGKEDFANAIEIYPQLLNPPHQELCRYLVSWSKYPIIKDENQFVNELRDNLPEKAQIIKDSLRIATIERHFYDAEISIKRGEFVELISSICKAFQYDNKIFIKLSMKKIGSFIRSRVIIKN